MRCRLALSLGLRRGLDRRIHRFRQLAESEVREFAFARELAGEG